MLSFERYFIGQQISVGGQKSNSNRCIMFPGAPWGQVGTIVRKTAKSVGIKLLLFLCFSLLHFFLILYILIRGNAGVHSTGVMVNKMLQDSCSSSEWNTLKRWFCLSMMATRSDGKAIRDTPLLVPCLTSLSETWSSRGDKRISLLPFSGLVTVWVLNTLYFISPQRKTSLRIVFLWINWTKTKTNNQWCGGIKCLGVGFFNCCYAEDKIDVCSVMRI